MPGELLPDPLVDARIVNRLGDAPGLFLDGRRGEFNVLPAKHHHRLYLPGRHRIQLLFTLADAIYYPREKNMTEIAESCYGANRGTSRREEIKRNGHSRQYNIRRFFVAMKHCERLVFAY